jgi:hypothetical protein
MFIIIVSKNGVLNYQGFNAEYKFLNRLKKHYISNNNENK